MHYFLKGHRLSSVLNLLQYSDGSDKLYGLTVVVVSIIDLSGRGFSLPGFSIPPA